MATQLHFADYLFWLLGFGAHCAILISMRRSAMLSTHRAFAGYLLFRIGKTATLFFVAHNLGYGSYFYAYWALGAVQVVVVLSVIHEVFRDTFAPYSVIPANTFNRMAMCLFVAASIVVLLPGADTWNRAMNAIRTLDSATSCIIVTLFLTVLGFSSQLGLPWRKPSWTIFIGFGVFYLVHIASSYAIAQLGAHRFYVDQTAYLFACLIWFFGAQVAVRPPRKTTISRLALYRSALQAHFLSLRPRHVYATVRRDAEVRPSPQPKSPART